jgi:putative colanic acid biosynthesis acetyltransferase WcaF
VERHGLSAFESIEAIVNRISLSAYRPTLDRGAPLIKEGLWQLCRLLFFLPSVPLPSRIRVGLLRVFGAKVGKDVVIRSGVNIAFPWRLSIGNDTWIGEGVTLLNLATIRIGDNTCISQRAFLCTGSHDFFATTFNLITGPINVSDCSWIAAQSFIGPNVSIGEGSMICAGAVITKNVPSFSIAKGNPAVVVARHD